MSGERHQATVTEAHAGPPSVNFRWGRPAFEAVDGIGPNESLAIMDGLVLAFGWIDNAGPNVVGSGVMVAPGLLVTATHVAEETRDTSGMAYSMLPRGGMRLWSPKQLHVLTGPGPLSMDTMSPRRVCSDVAVLSCDLVSDESAVNELVMACIEITVPRIGERLWATGFRQAERSGSAILSMYNTSGPVTDVHLQGRGSHLLGPCVEVGMQAYGGMSGGPVFNEAGYLIGIISSGFDSDDARGPTYVSLIWPALVAEVDAGWPAQLWRGGEASLKWARAAGLARIRGDVTWDKATGRLTGFSEQQSPSSSGQ